MPPKGPVIIAKNPNSGTGGVLPINPANTQNQPVKPVARLKLEVRRLPPGLTKDEFVQAFGDEWEVGAGNVDWMEYRQGKVKSPGKHPEQSRAYVHFTSEAHLKPFEAKFLSITFQDAKGTYKDQQLRGLPPTLGFAAIQRIPASKPRVDGRQGTIDQDPEYMAFLEAETQPVQKSAALDNGVTDKSSKEAVTTTPLIEALREKKANKEKAKAAKSAKKDDVKDDKQEKTTNKKGGRGAQTDNKTAVKEKAATKETAKGGNKQATKGASAVAAVSSASSPSGSPASNGRRERAPQNIKSMLQRDLGLSQNPRRGAKHDATSTIASSPLQATPTAAPVIQNNGGRNNRSPKKGKESGPVDTNAQVAQPSANGTATPSGIVKKGGAQPNTPKGPRGKANGNTPQGQVPSVASPVSSNAASTATTQTTVKSTKPAPQPSPGATKAYLKHANGSQGITEPLIQEALAVFGQVTSVEIDKRKGTALATFVDHESLKAAMAKRSVPVAQGAIEILEYKEKPAPAANRGNGTPAARGGSVRGRGRGGMGRGGNAVPTAASVVAPSATSGPAPAAAPAPPAVPSNGEAT